MHLPLCNLYFWSEVFEAPLTLMYSIVGLLQRQQKSGCDLGFQWLLALDLC